MFGPDIDLISDLEVRCRQTMLVCLPLVSDLGFGDHSPESRVEFVEIHRVFSSASEGEVPFGVDGDRGVVGMSEVDLGVDTSLPWSVEEVRDERERIPILLSDFVETPVVDTQSE